MRISILQNNNHDTETEKRRESRKRKHVPRSPLGNVYFCRGVSCPVTNTSFGGSEESPKEPLDYLGLQFDEGNLLDN